MTDPFENFAEQLRSYELLEAHRKALAADAADFGREHPDVPAVGLILDADASEAVAFRSAIESATGRDLAGRGFLGIAPREFVLHILRTNHPGAVDALEDSGGCGAMRRLPLVAVTKRGVRLGHVDYELAP
jgi:hypothetical protein